MGGGVNDAKWGWKNQKRRQAVTWARPTTFGAHLADGRAKFTLQHPLKGLQFLGGHFPTALQPFQQFHRSGHIWTGEEGAEASVGTSTASLPRFAKGRP